MKPLAGAVRKPGSLDRYCEVPEPCHLLLLGHESLDPDLVSSEGSMSTRDLSSVSDLTSEDGWAPGNFSSASTSSSSSTSDAVAPVPLPVPPYSHIGTSTRGSTRNVESSSTSTTTSDGPGAGGGGCDASLDRSTPTPSSPSYVKGTTRGRARESDARTVDTRSTTETIDSTQGRAREFDSRSVDTAEIVDFIQGSAREFDSCSVDTRSTTEIIDSIQRNPIHIRAVRSRDGIARRNADGGRWGAAAAGIVPGEINGGRWGTAAAGIVPGEIRALSPQDWGVSVEEDEITGDVVDPGRLLAEHADTDGTDAAICRYLGLTAEEGRAMGLNSRCPWREWSSGGAAADETRAAERYVRRAQTSTMSSNGSDTSSLLMALGSHPAQIRRRMLTRRLRVIAVKVRFVGVVTRVLRQQVCEDVLVPFLEDQGLDPLVIEYVLAWYRSGAGNRG